MTIGYDRRKILKLALTGAVTYLTADELKAIAAHWRVSLGGRP